MAAEAKRAETVATMDDHPFSSRSTASNGSRKGSTSARSNTSHRSGAGPVTATSTSKDNEPNSSRSTRSQHAHGGVVSSPVHSFV
jgi:hypothetical protein